MISTHFKFARSFPRIYRRVSDWSREQSKQSMRLLFLLNGGLGDVAHAMPLLFAVRSKYPHATIDLLVASSAGRELVELTMPDVNVTVKAALNSGSAIFRQLLRWRLNRYDYVFSGAHIHSNRSAILCSLIGARASVGLAIERYSWLYDHKISAIASENRADRYRALFTIIGLDHRDFVEGEREFKDIIARLACRADGAMSRAAGSRFMVALGNGADTVVRGNWNPNLKRIPRATWLRLGNAIQSVGDVEFLLLGTMQDTFPETWPGDSHVTDLRGTTSISKLLAILRKVSLVICNDTAILHLAYFTGTPYVAIFGPTQISRYAPQGGGICVAAKGKCCGCYPIPRCAGTECGLLANLDVETVVCHLRPVLSSGTPTQQTRQPASKRRE